MLRFQFSTNNKILGTQIGEYLKIQFRNKNNESSFERYFYAVSKIDEPNFFDILVHNQNQHGKLALALKSNLENFQVKLINKNFKYKYLGFSRFAFQNGENKNVDMLVIFVQNTNITAFFQLIETVCYYQLDPIQICVIYQLDDLVI